VSLRNGQQLGRGVKRGKKNQKRQKRWRADIEKMESQKYNNWRRPAECAMTKKYALSSAGISQEVWGGGILPGEKSNAKNIH